MNETAMTIVLAIVIGFILSIGISGLEILVKDWHLADNQFEFEIKFRTHILICFASAWGVALISYIVFSLSLQTSSSEWILQEAKRIGIEHGGNISPFVSAVIICVVSFVSSILSWPIFHRM